VTNATIRWSLLGLGLLVACNRTDAPPGPSVPTSTGNPPSVETPPVATTTPPPNVEPPPQDAVTKLAHSSNAFGFDLYARLRTEAGNLTVSPASLTTALGMTWGGAKGDTAAQMKKVLHLEGRTTEVMETSGKLAQSLSNSDRAIRFRIANRLFGEKTYQFESSYLDATKAAYGAPLEGLDFKKGSERARVHINGWVEQQTEKRIQNLIPPKGIDRDTRLVLVNAIYFLGDWDEPFQKPATRSEPFFATKTTPVNVPTMHATQHYRFVEQKELKAIELPYQKGDMSMLIVAPTAVDGIGQLEQSLDAKKLDAIVKSLTSENIFLSLPKFEVNPAESLSLGKLLVEMGMVDAFNRDKADFTGIANPPSPAERLFITSVFHKAFVRVDEKGTEAAAASAVAMAKAGAAPAQPKEMKVDRPFLFFIRDHASGLVLFMGRVADPSKK
jgi:serpin B